MKDSLMSRIIELSGQLNEDKPILQILSVTKDSFGRNFASIRIKFPSGEVYEEEYETSPYIIGKFRAMARRSPLKAYNFLKKNSSKRETEKQ